MKTTIQQFYSLLREAMFANKLTATDISARKGVHYTYIYNSIRNNANLTLQTAMELANAAGYKIELNFVPETGSAVLKGDMDSQGPLYSERRTKVKVATATATSTSTSTATEDPKTAAAAAAGGAGMTLDAEIEAMLADA